MRMIAALLALWVLPACAMGGAAAPPGYDGQPAEVWEVPRLEAELAAAKARFDEALTEVTAGDADACRDLCLHRRQICGMADRVCAVSERHPEHAEAAHACDSARAICADVTARTPAACSCRGDRAQEPVAPQGPGSSAAGPAPRAGTGARAPRPGRSPGRSAAAPRSAP